MEEPPARKPTQTERRHALRQQAQAGDPVAQARVDVLNASARASAAKAKAEGRGYWTPKAVDARKAQKMAAVALGVVPLTSEEKRRITNRRAKMAKAQRKRDARCAMREPR